jgi:hypothetical protein
MLGSVDRRCEPAYVDQSMHRRMSEPSYLVEPITLVFHSILSSSMPTYTIITLQRLGPCLYVFRAPASALNGPPHIVIT